MVVPAGEPPGKSLDGLLADLPRGQKAGVIGTPSSAHFESPKNIAATSSLAFETIANKQSKLFLGVVGGEVITGEPLRDGRPNRWVEGGMPIGVADDRNSLLIAGSRSGKGRSALVPQLTTLPKETSVFCVDPKGDLARLTATYRAGLQRVGVLDAFGCSGDITKPYRCSFNPIDVLLRSDRSTFVANARMIADAIVVMDDMKEKHWSECAAQMITALIAHVATHVNYAGARNLVTVWKLASDLASVDPQDPSSFWLEKEMLASDAAGGMVRAAARQFYNRTGGEFSSVLSCLSKHLDFISYECIQDTLVGDSIDLRDLKRDLLTLYVVMPALRMGGLKGWMRLLVTLTLAAFEEEPTQKGNQAVIQLDEFHALGRLTALETSVAQIAGLGAKLEIVLQDLGQLQVYEKNWQTFIANSGLIQIMGCADEATLEYVSKRLGQALVFNRSANAPTFDQATKQAVTGESWSATTHPLMTAEEISRYFSRDDKKLRQLILRPGYHPLILQRVFYDSHRLFHGRFQEEVPQR